jgi:hypothetical protein
LPICNSSPQSLRLIAAITPSQTSQKTRQAPATPPYRHRQLSEFKEIMQAAPPLNDISATVLARFACHPLPNVEAA